MRNLKALGVPKQKVYEWTSTRRGYWRLAGSPVLNRAMPNAYWRNHGLVGFIGSYRRFGVAE